MNITRREILRFVGGSALGLLLTPVPWKVLDDSAVWTQNWPWIPEPNRGDSSYKLTTCTLCAAACGMRARCVSNQPVSLSGIQTHPLNQGALCPIGMVAHHLRYHPARVMKPLRITSAHGSSPSTIMTFDEVLHDISVGIKDAGVTSQAVAVVDGRPGRTASLLFQQFATQVPHGKYISYGEPSLDLLDSMFEKPVGQCSYDLDHAQTILSFGVPLLDSWGTPARAARYLEKKSEGKQKIIQIESFMSRTAGMADHWIPIRPGTDVVFALGLAHIILKEHLYKIKAKDIKEFESFVSSYPPSVVTKVCNVSQETLLETARMFSASTSSVAVIDGLRNSREAQAAVMILNLLAGSVGRSGGITVQREIPTGLTTVKKNASIHTRMESIPDHSIRVIILDESLSGCQLSNALLEQKLTNDGMLISLSPFVTERSFCTQYVVPAPMFLESLTELSTSFDSGSSSMSISCPLVPRPTNVLTPIEFTQQLAAVAGVANIESGSTEELLKKRITAIFSEKHGSIFNASTGQVTEVKNLLSADDLWNALNTGGCWMDSEESKKPFPAFRLTEFLPVIDIHKMQAWKDQRMLVPVVEKTVYNNSEISPLMSKVGQESGLRPFGCRVYLHPTTINGLDITDGCRVQVQTKKGSMKAEAHLDDTIMPGVVGISHTMDPQSLYALCEVNSDGSIYPTPVKIQKV